MDGLGQHSLCDSAKRRLNGYFSPNFPARASPCSLARQSHQKNAQKNREAHPTGAEKEDRRDDTCGQEGSGSGNDDDCKAGDRDR
jgi:hypothetical protein